MKGFEIKRENEKPAYLFNRYDVVSAIAHAIYYTVNPETEMCIPNCAYEQAEKEFDDWFNDTRIKKAIETLNEDDKLTKAYEKKAKEYSTSSKVDYVNNIAITLVKQAYKDGAEFGYNKAKIEVEESYKESLYNEEMNLKSVTERLEELEKAKGWHYVKEVGTPTKEGHYLVCLRNKNHDIFDCWILFDKDIGLYSLQVRLVDIYAWKEIVLPELKEIKEND